MLPRVSVRVISSTLPEVIFTAQDRNMCEVSGMFRMDYVVVFFRDDNRRYPECQGGLAVVPLSTCFLKCAKGSYASPVFRQLRKRYVHDYMVGFMDGYDQYHIGFSRDDHAPVDQQLKAGQRSAGSTVNYFLAFPVPAVGQSGCQ